MEAWEPAESGFAGWGVYHNGGLRQEWHGVPLASRDHHVDPAAPAAPFGGFSDPLLKDDD